MEGKTIDILVTLDQNYLPQLKVLMTSLFINDPGEYRLYLLHSSIPEEKLRELEAGLQKVNCTLHPLSVDEGLFAHAPVTKQYPQEMYYRLLAAQILPQELHKVLYLDPDTLIINPIAPLWEMDIKGAVFAAAAHTGKTDLANNVNRIRLKTEGKYFNSGVMLIDLDRARERVDPEEIFAFVREHASELVLPDQDVLNVLYERDIFEIDDFLWNYDARKFSNYFLRSSGEADMDWVMAHTAILHFCGKAKPWKPHYTRRFGVLYRHYMQLVRKYW